MSIKGRIRKSIQNKAMDHIPSNDAQVSNDTVIPSRSSNAAASVGVNGADDWLLALAVGRLVIERIEASAA